MAQCKTVDISKMPHNVLKDFLNGDLSFQDAYKKYPSGHVLEVTKMDEEAEQEDNVTVLTCVDDDGEITRWSVDKEDDKVVPLSVRK